MLKFDLRVKLGRVTSGAKIAVSAFNHFEFNWDCYNQVRSVAMGERMVPPYACFFAVFFKEKNYQEYVG